MAEFIVGIDLGTTNSALAWAEGAADEGIRVMDVPQLVNPGEIGARTLLPSFLYLPGPMDFPAGSLALPWDAAPPHVVGELARQRGAQTANRLVASAKSWLSYGGANRTGGILPWNAPDDEARLSPVDASAAYLRHLAAAFDAQVAGGKGSRRLARQDVLLTVPASFDEEARELTLRAARAAGLEHVTLIEEPQAAFYAWLDAMGDGWRTRVGVGDLVLVCDIGGGTTDFSLIAVTEREGDLALERVAVGEHILLGGDNMDLALARRLQQRLESNGHRIDTAHLHTLWHQSRIAKESLLADPAQGERTITLLGRGSRLIGGAIKTVLTLDDVNQVLLEGFFPPSARDEMPARARRTGLQELGLPYAADAAITRHLARFLSRQPDRPADVSSPPRRGQSGLACPTHVLFNGGVMKAPALRARVVDVLSGWLRQEGFGPLDDRHVLEAADLDHAVAQGATYYGMARCGRGIRIRSGASRAYYVGIESAMPAVPGFPAPLKALCVVPFGMEEGTSATVPHHEFGLVVGEPAEFRFLSSTVRQGDQPGALIQDWGDDLEELGPLEVTLDVDSGSGVDSGPDLDGRFDLGSDLDCRFDLGSDLDCLEESRSDPTGADPTGAWAGGGAAVGTVIPVRLESRMTEIGTMEVWCVARDGGRRWKLELNIREGER